jgi:hypothetical protein
MHFNGKKLGMDKNGGIEGLPLQLLIIVLVAGVGSAIIMGWMGGLEAPESIGSVHSSMNEILLDDDDGDGIFSTEGVDLCIIVLDQNGDPITGASVSLEGSGIESSEAKRPHAVTDVSGKAYFEGLTLNHAGSSISYVKVMVAKTGIASTRSISVPVVCE